MKGDGGIKSIMNALDLMNNIEMVDIACQTDPIRIALSAPSITFEEKKHERKASLTGALDTRPDEDQNEEESKIEDQTNNADAVEDATGQEASFLL